MPANSERRFPTQQLRIMSAQVASDPVKVRVIVTEFVEADPLSFKAVVQRLTGRDSNHAAGFHGGSAASEKQVVHEMACNGVEDGYRPPGTAHAPPSPVEESQKHDDEELMRMCMEIPDDFYELLASWAD